MDKWLAIFKFIKDKILLVVNSYVLQLKHVNIFFAKLHEVGAHKIMKRVYSTNWLQKFNFVSVFPNL